MPDASQLNKIRLFNIMAELQNGLPPGWDCLKDEKTGRL